MKTIKDYIFNIKIPAVTAPAAGKLLVAEPFLRENYFNHAVICLFDHEPEGEAMGVVLNNVSDRHLGSLIDGVREDLKIPVYVGGPVGTDRLFFLHTMGELIPNSSQIIPGLWIGGSFEAVLNIINDGYPTEGNLRFYIGHSGWSRAQLDGEIENNVWAVAAPPDPHFLLSAPDDAMWHEMVRRLGPDYRGWLYHPRNTLSN